MEKKYSVGDRVKIVDEFPKGSDIPSSAKQWLGKTMTIARIQRRFIGGDLVYFMREDWGEHAWGHRSIASLAEDEKHIVISCDNKNIRVNEIVNGKVVKSTKTLCKVGDDSNLEAELKVAIEDFFKKRLEMYSGKIVCVQACSDSFTRGKIYEVDNGTLVDDNGDEYKNLRCFNDIRYSLESEFIEIVDSEVSNVAEEPSIDASGETDEASRQE